MPKENHTPLQANVVIGVFRICTQNLELEGVNT